MKTTLLSKEELRSICGGKATNLLSQGFPCRVVEADGTVRETITSTIEECLEFAG
ncbi:MAG: hypothetical protein H9777_08870 [Candidatus Phocaeicola faecigallinarum]|uniref:Uncharacterized protein n=1 Tax=Candidatus Phocaeicola faecigallinarum TaxID=2838732 RepID=A0A948TCL0_9BACT|nr:hypothetical protein [uncultured Bacteroides sp.]MBU3838405.1 hypothetical protein [Candidatus Phocaeicola faecigallinarum]